MLFLGCQFANFQIQMESQDCKLEILGEQTQCRNPKTFLTPSYFYKIPSDQELLSLLMGIPSSSPFIVSEDFLVFKQNQLKDIRSFKIREKILNYNRKQKSLQELSKKFFNRFQGRNIDFLELDKVTEELGVERRRIYDVINILESLNVVTKKEKNHYRWKGLKQAVKTIIECEKNPCYVDMKGNRKEKSLEYLANSFLKLILRKNIISLEEAAKQINENLSQEILKTKVRRLYDIVNVFKSLKLVKKITLSNKKPGFKWLGVEDLKDFIEEKNESKVQDSLISNELQTPTKTPEMKIVPQISNSFFMKFVSSNKDFNTLNNLGDIFSHNLFHENLKEVSKIEKEQESHQSQQLYNNFPLSKDTAQFLSKSGFNRC